MLHTETKLFATHMLEATHLNHPEYFPLHHVRLKHVFQAYNQKIKKYGEKDF
jgi:hypothetical protein